MIQKLMTSRECVCLLAQAAADTKARDIVVLNLQKLTSFTDFFVICSGTSDRHVMAIVDHMEEQLKKKKRRPLGIEGGDAAHWILVDCGDVVAHVFHDDERRFYQLEKLWGDAPRVRMKLT